MGVLANARHERFYVYAVRIAGRTRYVGKGCGRRATIHLTRSHNETLAAEIGAAQAAGERVRTRIIRRDMPEDVALRLERRLIAKWRAKLVNVSMGSFTPLEHVAMQARANLRCLKSEEQVRREGDRRGVSVERRVELLARIRAELTRMAKAA